MIRWQLFPRSARPVNAIRSVIKVFEEASHQIDSSNHGLESNKVLSVVSVALTAAGFNVEQGKTKDAKIPVPVLFGLNGAIEKSFYADAFHSGDGVVLEVEAGRAVDNNQFLKDLFQACMMQDAQHLVICVRNNYRGSNDFEKVVTFFDTLYASQRMILPLKSILILGY